MTVVAYPDVLKALKYGAGADSAILDTLTHNLVVIPHQHSEIHEGDAFRYYDSVTLGVAGVQDYMIVTPNTTKWCHFLFAVDGTAVTSFVLYEGGDRTGTTLQTAINANRNSATAATSLVYKGTSGGATDGTTLLAYSSGTATNQSRAGSTLEPDEFILKQNTKYIIRITSASTGNLCNIHLVWYEHTSLT